MQRFIFQVPATAEEWHKIAEEFKTKWDHPCCIGALSGKHVAIHQPSESGSEYYNHKHFYSVLLLALVDANYRFVYVDVGPPGRAGDAGMFSQSTLKYGLDKNTLNLPPAERVDGIPDKIPYHIVADDAFPLSEHIMTPFTQTNLDKPERIFNYRLARSRRVVENVFGLMVNRFQVLLTMVNLSPEKVTQVILAACCLHNFMVDNDRHVEDIDGHSIVDGVWRNDRGLSGMSARSKGNPNENATTQRRELTECFSSDFGSVACQHLMIDH